MYEKTLEQHPAVPPVMQAWIDRTYNTESPLIYARFAAISAVAALLERKVWTKWGKQLFPNMYVLLVGEPASRKSTNINRVKEYLAAVGYNKFSPDHLNRQRLLKLLATGAHANAATKKIMQSAANAALNAMHGESRKHKESWVKELLEDINFEDYALEDAEISTDSVMTNSSSRKASAMYLLLNELVDMQSKAPDLLTTLNNLWDSPPVYIDSMGTIIQRPCINMFAAINPASFGKVFPLTEMQSGLITRMVLVHGKRYGNNNILPFDMPDFAAHDAFIIDELQKIAEVEGEVVFDKSAREIFRAIVQYLPRIPDQRFNYYYDRRSELLAKLSMIIAAMRCSLTITDNDVIFSNTILMFNEWNMTDALGDYGVSVVVKTEGMVVNALRRCEGKLTLAELRKALNNLVPNIQILAEAIKSLETSGTIVNVGGMYHLTTRNISAWDVYNNSIVVKSMLPEWLKEEGTL